MTYRQLDKFENLFYQATITAYITLGRKLESLGRNLFSFRNFLRSVVLVRVLLL